VHGDVGTEDGDRACQSQRSRAEPAEAPDDDGERGSRGGRRRDNITNRNEAINAPVQGTAADGLKMAMAEVHKRLRKFEGTAFIVATIHDELLVECNEPDGPEVLEMVQEAMVESMDSLINAEEPHVPIEVEGTVTKVWSKG